ncbi:MAG: 16S rRNA (guanine(527)-N(7))-methyltransferase RsmG [Candidatus Cardinium sp.]|uniref:16S rRNA (guanine(527)-N(7))-methyltransferase RsmG n=1 Tax=Candidatus Cardinium sp. TP TaxID=2961955 RepID=UPI0021B04041|nr:16S rRNA (guanine(527)-N(7))-methyltransferase RsmG [Candidatus Cardinium sp. TP]MCT4696957.1 16S rRNA (guanine(527)-N(7))-methyltransferase RsmG [Candidatus Cardinium sp. TP]MDN5247377.1 16S rRNA (guanine(527)-N(7))-methyltransferase RsmG [Candidatus Cardinium sp.]
MDQLQKLDTVVSHYFPELSPAQITLFCRLGDIYTHWNSKLNLISRKDIAHLYLHHILHSLAIAQVTIFVAHTKILDVGTGGGFPGIPLAILFPEVHFHLVDATAKKIEAVVAIVAALGLKNVSVDWARAEALTGQYDFIVGRGVANLLLLYSWVKDKIAEARKNKLHNGILYLKGAPFEPLPLVVDLYPLQRYFTQPFFKEKYLVHAYSV